VLLELCSLSKALDDSKISRPSAHHHIHYAKKGAVVFAELDDDGSISLVSLGKADRSTDAWTYRESAGSPAFPIFNATGLSNKTPKILVKGGSSNIYNVIADLRNALDLENMACVDALMQRVEAALADPDAFCASLASEVLSLQACLNGELDGKSQKALADIVDGILYGKKGLKVPLCFRLSGASNYDTDVFSPEVRGEVIKQLIAAQDSRAGLYGKCHVTGKVDLLWEGAFPAPNLPAIGMTKFFSSNKDTPSLSRYGCCGGSRCRVGYAAVRSAFEDILFMTDVSRENVTYCSSNGNLIVSYVESAPTVNLFQLGLIAAAEADAVSQRTFELAAKEFIDRINLKDVSVTKEDRLRVLILAKVDSGNCAIALNKNLTISSMISLASAWRDGLDNHPDLRVQDAAAKGANRLYPVSLYSEGNRRYVSSAGSLRIESEPIFRISDGFDLFFTHDARLLNRIVGSIVDGSVSLVMAKKSSQIDKYTVAKLMALLLYLSGRTKEDYMESYAFLLGNVLQLMDLIHKEYHSSVRGCKNPTSLIGASAFRAVRQNPSRGFDYMTDRAKFLTQWVKTGANGQGGSPNKLALWAKSVLENDVYPKMASMNIPQKMTTNERAELTIGYWARIPSKNTDKDENKND